MRLGRGRSEQPDLNEEPVSRPEPSEKVRVKVACELGIWLPCPRVFPAGHDAESWSRLASTMWWGQSGLAHDDNAVDQLAAVFRSVREIGYARVHSHQFWIYLRDPAAQPLPVYICVWKQQGERDRRRAVERQHRLHQRRTAAVARGVDLVHDALEQVEIADRAALEAEAEPRE